MVIEIDANRIDAASAVKFKDDMLNVTRDGPRRVIVNLGQVEFLDSSGLGAIVATMKALGSSRRMDLVGMRPVVEKVFRLTRMDSVFRIFPDLDSAQWSDLT